MTPTSSPGSSRESSRCANHDACAAISANAAAGQSAFPRTMWSHNVAASIFSARDTSNRARVSSSAKIAARMSHACGFGTAQQRVASPTVNRRDTNCRDPSSRAHRTMACALVPWNANAETEASPGRFVSITEGIAANRRGAVARNGAEDPRTAERNAASTCRFISRRCGIASAARRTIARVAARRPIAPAAGSACPTALLTAPSTSDEVTDIAEAVNASAAAPISMGSPSAVPVPCI